MSWEVRIVPVQAVVGILKQNDRILVAERPVGKPYSGYWEFPGGKIEADETAYSALKRELSEELGIQVINAHAWFSHSHVYPDKTVFLHIWVVEQFQGEPCGKENQRLQWVTFDEMCDLKILQGNVAIIDRMADLFLNKV